MRLLIALSFLTIFPVRFRREITEEELAQATVYFPIVGLFIGSILVVINEILKYTLPGLLLNIILVFLLLLLTRFLHIDGFVDTIDGFVASDGKEKILKVMQESYIGSIGMICALFLIFSKIAILYEMEDILKNKALILSPVYGRFFMVYSFYFYNCARERSKAVPFFKYTTLREFVIALLLTLFICTFYLFLISLIVFGALFLLTYILCKYITKKIDGLTGDTLGAINEVIELTSLFLILVLSALL